MWLVGGGSYSVNVHVCQCMYTLCVALLKQYGFI